MYEFIMVVSRTEGIIALEHANYWFGLVIWPVNIVPDKT